MGILVFDIEAVPADVSTDNLIALSKTAERLQYKDVETYMSLTPPLAQVAAIGCRWYGEADKPTYIYYNNALFLTTGDQAPHKTPDKWLVCCDNEADTLKSFELQFRKDIEHIVTFGGRGYDVPLLYHRSLANRLRPHPLITKAAFQKSWYKYPHVDLLEKLTFSGAMKKSGLQDICIAYGIDNPKQGHSGSNVKEMVDNRDLDGIVTYLEGDVLSTEELYNIYHELGEDSSGTKQKKG